MTRRARVSGWGALAFTHRWLGIAGCLLFLLWFVSGIAMMYVRMPALTAQERFAHAIAIDVAAIRISPAEAAATAGVDSRAAMQLVMLARRPVYRFGEPAPTTVFADTRERLDGVSRDAATRVAQAFAPEHASTLHYIALLESPDQWTLQLRAHFPLHHFSLGDAAGTEIYVSSTTGDVVMQASRSERRWAYVGPVAHWLYLPVLRRNGPLWTQVIVWSSAVGCVLCLSGLLAGVLRFAPFRSRVNRRETTLSPYTGWMKWHHYAGLVFGVVTLTWTFSGLLSMGPFPLLSSEGITPDQRRAVTGAGVSFDAISLDHVRTALRSSQDHLAVKELRLITFRGQPYWSASESPSRHRLVSATSPDEGVFERFVATDVESAAIAAAPSGAAVDLTWLDDYDEYYYDRAGARPLPVLRARYADAAGTWMYLDPARGAIALVVRRPDRLNRWLYHGLHSLDPSWLRSRRPHWDLAVIVLSLGGIAGVLTSLAPAWQRLRRHARRALRAPLPPHYAVSSQQKGFES